MASLAGSGNLTWSVNSIAKGILVHEGDTCGLRKRQVRFANQSQSFVTTTADFMPEVQESRYDNLRRV